MNPPEQEPSGEKIQKKLFKNAMKGNWKVVVDIYNDNPEVHNAKITRSGDTALHIAIADVQESIVEELVRIVEKSALETKNELGNTPLHLAAYLGNVKMCECIAKRDSTLMGIRNNDNETPFFLAVLHGRKDAFLRLHKLCEEEEGYRYCKGRDGETILHSAISGEYFDLAFQIIHRYPKLIDSVNEQGFTPLHILASKPSAFRSGSHIRGFHKLIYQCIFVDELQPKTSQTLAEKLQYDEEKGNKYPENYQTCVGMFVLLKHIIRVLMGYPNQQQDRAQLDHEQGSSENKNNQKVDTEQQKPASEQEKSKAQRREFFPKNYLTCFHFLKFIAKVMLVIFGFGSIQVVKIREKKQKHVWSVQIMEKLLEHASTHEYDPNYGRSPLSVQTEKDGEIAPFALGDGGSVDFSLEAPMAHDDQNEPPPQPDKSKSEEPNNQKVERKGETCDTEKCRELLCSFLSLFGDGLVKDKKRAMNALGCAKRESRGLEMEKKETSILIAAKNGIREMVAMILEMFPVAIHDTNSEEKNIVLLAVENRQPHVYELLLKQKTMREVIFRKTDKDGNSALHLAAMLGEYRPWLIPGAALQMQWEIKWYEFVKNSMPLHFFPRYNKNFQTPKDIFSETHSELAKEGGQWLTNTSQSCSVVAALIATVAFATSATVPGGVKQESGTPTLENEPAFGVFAISSLVALCFSVTSVVMFLAILTSRYQEKDFGKVLPRMLLAGLTSLFVSIGSMLLSFCAGHFFVLKEKLKYAAFPMYAITCLPVTFFAAAQFPLYFDLVKATIRKVPQRSSK